MAGFLTVHCQNSEYQVTEERMMLFTDRMIYIAGEQIHFTAFTFYPGNGEQKEISKVFYSELINTNGNRVIGAKHLIRNSSGSGCLSIPPDIVSGNYFIKAYTKVMRAYVCCP